MREIKYKVWHIEHKKWIHDELDIFLTSDGNVYEKYDYGYETCIRDITNAVEVLFFTGLKDKNGKEIFEGYVVQTVGTTLDDIGIVKFIDGSYLVEAFDGKDGWFLFQETEENEILGNVYDNPDLIQKAD